MAPRRESKDDRHLKLTTKKRLSPPPQQRKRASSVPATSPRRGSRRGEFQQGSTSNALPSPARLNPNHSTAFQRSPSLSPVHRETMKISRFRTGRRGAEMGRYKGKEKQERLEMELVKLMDRATLTEWGREENSSEEPGNRVKEKGVDNEKAGKAEEMEDQDNSLRDTDMG